MALPKSSLVSKIGGLGMEWLQWFSRTDQTVIAQRAYGPTTSRPGPNDAYIGMRYLDTELGVDVIGMPIYAVKVETSGVTWVDGQGNTV